MRHYYFTDAGRFILPRRLPLHDGVYCLFYLLPHYCVDIADPPLRCAMPLPLPPLIRRYAAAAAADASAIAPPPLRYYYFYTLMPLLLFALIFYYFYADEILPRC